MCVLLFYLDLGTTITNENRYFTITAEILARSLANFYCQQADRNMKFIIYAILTQRARAENLKSRSVTF